jgi:hypothetical protein
MTSIAPSAKSKVSSNNEEEPADLLDRAEDHETLVKRLYGGEGGILTQPLSASYHLFSNLHENRINIGDFYVLACFNSFNHSA